MTSVDETIEQFVNCATDLARQVNSGQLPLKAFLKSKLPDYYAHLDKAISAFNLTSSPPIACNDECGACCRTLVAISPMEALNIWFQLRSHFSSNEVDVFRQGIMDRLIIQQDIIKKHLGDFQNQAREFTLMKIPCEFQKSNYSCSIYEFRPFICRSHNVVSPPDICLDTEHPERALIWRHPTLWKFDMTFQTFFSKFYFNMEGQDTMEHLLLKFENFNTDLKIVA